MPSRILPDDLAQEILDAHWRDGRSYRKLQADLAERGYTVSHAAISDLIAGRTYRELKRDGLPLPFPPNDYALGYKATDGLLAAFRDAIGLWSDQQLVEWVGESKHRLEQVPHRHRSSPVEYELLCSNAVLLELVLRRLKPCQCRAEPASAPEPEKPWSKKC